mmetsp:Transcript_36219/g.65440  ORF Transcript_36219/g.65440 Transcript_36219/m.65440 type:complete len:228 (+) Transcript_36219:276-959(+)
MSTRWNGSEDVIVLTRPYLSCGKPPAGGWSACWKGPRPKEGCRKRAFRKKSCASHCAWWKVAAAWQRGQRKAMRLLQLWYRLSTIYVTTPQAAHGCRSWSGKVFSGVLWLPRPSENFRRVPSFGIATGSIAPACISSRTMDWYRANQGRMRLQSVTTRTTRCCCPSGSRRTIGGKLLRTSRPPSSSCSPSEEVSIFVMRKPSRVFSYPTTLIHRAGCCRLPDSSPLQ